MVRYLLDANVVIVFQKAGHLSELAGAAERVPIVMVDDVQDELTKAKPGKPSTPAMRDAERALGSSAIQRIEIHDVHATILHLLGVDHMKLTFRSQGRDFRLTDIAGHLIKPLLA